MSMRSAIQQRQYPKRSVFFVIKERIVLKHSRRSVDHQLKMGLGAKSAMMTVQSQRVLKRLDTLTQHSHNNFDEL